MLLIYQIAKTPNSRQLRFVSDRLRIGSRHWLFLFVALWLFTDSGIAQMPTVRVSNANRNIESNRTSVSPQPVPRQINVAAELAAQSAERSKESFQHGSNRHTTRPGNRRQLAAKQPVFQRANGSPPASPGNVIRQPTGRIRQPQLRPRLANRSIPAGLAMFQLDGDAGSSPNDSASDEFLQEILGGLDDSQSEDLDASAASPADSLAPVDSSEFGEFEPVNNLPSRDLPKKLPEPEVVVPLPTVPPDDDFSGFGDFRRPPKETLPDPDAPPAYQWPPRPKPQPAARPNSLAQPNFVSPGNINQPWQFDQPNKKPNNAVPPAEWNILSQDAIDGILRLDTDRVLQLDDHAERAAYSQNDFLPTPVPQDAWCPTDDIDTYYGKRAVPTQRPLIEIGRPFYGNGILQPGRQIFSEVNPVTPSLLVYGDYRTGVGIHRVNGEDIRNYAHRLNLDINLQLTGTERLHAFIGPLDENGKFTRLDFSDSGNVEFEDEIDVEFNTGFFEGDAGAIVGSLTGNDAPFDLPFTFGLVPLIYQNGIWLEDALAGGAISFPWKHSRLLNWANFDATFFAGFDQVTSAAFFNDDRAAIIMGTAWFIEAYNGYIEADYAYLSDQNGTGLSYHNFGLSYTRRYFDRVSNSIRYIGNVGQQGPRPDRTADGGLLLIENALISSQPNTFVPYANFFIGHGTPQSAARAGGSGGILRNTGISFESDGLTGSPTLDATGHNAYGGAIGINWLSADFTRQTVLEFAALDTFGNPLLSSAPGAQYGFAARYQKALNNWSQIRADVIGGILDNSPNLYGSRIEFRWKF